MRRRRSVSAQELDYYRTHFLEAIREDGVVCLECGNLLLALARHLTPHGMTLDDYKEKWGYNKGRGLIAPSVSTVLRDHALARDQGARQSPEFLRKGLEASRRHTRAVRLEARLTRAAVMRARLTSEWQAPGGAKKVDDDTLRALVADDPTVLQIAERTGEDVVTVWRRLRNLGVGKPVGPGVTDDELLEFRRTGLWPRDIAARTGLSVRVVSKRLWRISQRGISVPRPTGPKPSPRRRVTDDELLGLAREGLGATEIAVRVALHPSNVRRRLRGLRRRGMLPPRPSPESREVLDARILALCQAGLSNREVDTHGLTPVALGIRTRSPTGA